MKVKLSDVIEVLDFSNDEIEYYYNTKTEEIIMRIDGIFNGDDNLDLEDDMEENSEDYISFPSKYEINEYDIMRSFIYDLPEGKAQDSLFSAISGRGAFRKFKDKVYDVGIEKKWFEYRDAEYERIARKWCEENDIEII